MTALDKRKTKLVFTTCSTVRERSTSLIKDGGIVVGKKHGWKDRAIVVECTPTTAIVRLSGLRRAYPISFNSIYNAAVRVAVERERAERKAKKARKP